MKTQIVHLPALILSAAIHSGLWLAGGTAGTRTGVVDGAAAPFVISVELRSGENTAVPSLSRSDDRPSREQAMEALEPSLPHAEPVLPIIKAQEPHYFRTTQLTQKPVVLHDASRELILVLPELPEQVAILRLYVSDHGSIDKVVVEESQLSEAAERRVIDAFSKISFQPGKIGRIAVRSQVRIEVRTADFSFPREKHSQHAGDLPHVAH